MDRIENGKKQNLFEAATFLHPPAACRSVPFWSWNDKLEPDELRRQIGEMKLAGLGGFFMHTRQGLLTPYMGEAFMDAVEVAVNEAEIQGLEAWCYDENGWPSGTANGIVPQLGLRYQQKSLEGIKVMSEGADEQIEMLRQNEDFKYLLVRHKKEKRWRMLESSLAEGDWDEGIAVMCRVNPYYIDILSEKAIEAFIEACHEVYFQRFGERFGKRGIPGIFTDEFKFSGIPWSDGFDTVYQERYGESVHAAVGWLLAEADEQDQPVLEEAYRLRYAYWRLVTERFQHSVGLVADWCDAHGWQLTGHFMGEDTLAEQMHHTAGVMPLYEKMHMPGIDMLGRDTRSVLLPKQAASVARQLGKDFVITETFGCCGWNLSFREMKKLAEWQFVLGVNRLCPHLQSYSIRGVRKRDYPPSLYVQQPWWDVYKQFNDYFARLTYLLTLGEANSSILVLHPIRTAWLQNGQRVKDLQAHMEALAAELLALQRDFDYGDEALIRNYGKAAEGLLHVGCQNYDTVIVSGLLTLDVSTFALLKLMAAESGKVILIGEAPCYLEGKPCREVASWFASDAVIRVANVSSLAREDHVLARKDWLAVSEASPDAMRYLYVQERRMPGMKLLYAVHTGDTGFIELQIQEADKRCWTELILEQGTESKDDVRAMASTIKLAPGESKFFAIRDCTEDAGALPVAKETSAAPLVIPLEAAWQYRLNMPNVITLDYAVYRIDGGDWMPSTYVLNIQENCIAMQRPVHIEMVYTFETADELLLHTDQSLWKLAIERPEYWQVEVNGQSVYADEADGWLGGDRSFPTIPIGRQVKAGWNAIRISGLFQCNEETYRFFGVVGANLAPIRNKLIFDVEIESLYVLGPFAVQPAVDWESAVGDALWTEGPFLLTDLPEKLHAEDITRQGLSFYAGRIVLNQSIPLSESVRTELRNNSKRLVLQWDNMRCPAFGVTVNGQRAGTVLWGANQLELSVEPVDDMLNLEIEVITSGRNTFGPHHHLKGEVMFVGPTSFTDKIGWVDAGAQRIWTDRYCLVSFGLSGIKLLLV
ncbi:hypothetical protein BC351_07210 [Paenibacillus ferrarius]|uniref:Glycoside hydrolase n=1 Tax=Paenibacillus ferrarius TaxID=1469647 RepID=A0A1V4HDG8_9BACL|nr:glycosyl hydrolase [Paenibacillus ferrarius]OPH50439.1 hypothetical protein BC351_07210 [Paenibacillus ferrarius]